ncbi:hypothetical protein [Flavobacterium columnare]|uniref:hypothetical protein n=1 Tax=Flavobacterium columnare TaxID=996 RepID=UPI0016513932|nr:hypothetical protein [Flavobacterium columnare]QOG57793.1 hypothetical protein HUE29_10690 [Flavobacterium columnare]QOG60517.1 hypothetical protein HUE30_10690 [Flavobacterium columnare]QOG63237.1 hypothetical protein HUE31_10690 [Flavobacterium columnare]QOG65960.1 hypothetical protein HUE32_10700 [Flavobacterium columnare]QOG68684.1 hypothetical protein HUE33_10685 [Flavobacterium columnare]
MVRIVNYLKRTTEEGKEFFVLEIQSGITMVKSATTGKFYATANKATLSSTFDELTCQALIGTELAGKVEKVACEPYEYTIKDTGEIITLSHRFEYVDENQQQEMSITNNVERSTTKVEDFISGIDAENTFSKNGVLEHA